MSISNPCLLRRAQQLTRCSLTALALFALAACSSDTGQKPEKTQVAAVVNGVEITQREVELIYKRTEAPGTPVAIAAAQQRAILADLVNTELLAQQAVADKLDATPDLMVEAHLARRQALARLIERQTVQGVAAVPPDALRKMVDANPLGFGGRKLLVLEEIALATADTALLDKLDRAATQGATMDRLEQIAREAKVVLRRGLRNTATDQLPPAVAQPLLDAKPGTPIVVQNAPGRGVVLLLRSAAPAPLIGDAAIQAAANAANLQLRRQALQQQVQQAAAAATIVYHGAYAPGAAPVAGDDALPEGANVPQVALPAGAATPPAQSLLRRLGIAAAAVLACALAVLVRVHTLSYWRGWLWLPRPWPERWLPIYARTEVDAHLVDPASFDAASGLGKAALTVGSLALAGLLSVQLFMAWQRLPVWGLPLGIAGGLLLGVVASHLLAHSWVRQASRQARWWPVALFMALLLATSYAGIRIS